MFRVLKGKVTLEAVGKQERMTNLKLPKTSMGFRDIRYIHSTVFLPLLRRAFRMQTKER